MPELPEVETVMRALAVRLVGRRFTEIVQRRPDLRFPLPERLAVRLEGRSLTGFARRAKFIQAFLDDGNALLLHLGMSGRLLLDAPPAGRHEHLTFTFDDGTVLRFVDPRRFGLLDLWPAAGLPRHRLLAGLGLEPLDGGLTAGRLRALLAGRQVAVKTAIMDQRLIVGVGNIYASEALFRAGIAPRRLACDIGARRAARLAAAIPQVLEHAIASGGSSLRDYVQTSGELGNFQSDFRVYGREDAPCVDCARPIRRIVQGGRATFFCLGCQR
ncbi:bifunctional DNA-formamidopyrimidine glycosylase/DNA-(apurinic or apyrimidinic site) lyase [Marinimicrococcus flavescens]|uniref:Formamidopyrimidine-DNA glycosylase n=1 Tax=Marinimicrococcus flavescens TaxID=3031815 RepID=A0AAP3XQW2_9PROT|nr:bifunctional DNA-formamidopyrimidine glycosylase/DNA-(apurinic or apyrimidinic site) lyase [Marinimicrococcus flavescens]